MTEQLLKYDVSLHSYRGIHQIVKINFINSKKCMAKDVTYETQTPAEEEHPTSPSSSHSKMLASPRSLGLAFHGFI